MKQVLGFLPIGGKVRGNDVHIISGPHRLFLFLNLHFLQIAHFPLDIADRLGLVDRLDMQVDRHRIVQVQKLCQHPVRQLRRQNLQEGDSAGILPNAEGLAVLREGKAGRRDKILCREAGFGKVAPGKLQFLLPAGVELAVQKLQPFQPVQRSRLDAQGLKVVQYIRFHTLQAHFRGTQVVRLNAKGDILPFGKAVISFFKLIFEHFRILTPDVIVLVPLGRDGNALGKVLHIGPLVDKGELDADGGIKVIEKITVILENLRLIVRLGKLVVNIEKLNGLGI